MHVAMVGMDGEKMSKSLGNLVLVRDLLVDHEPDTIRLYLLRHHYRQAWSWQEQRFLDMVAHTRVLHAAMRRTSGEGRELPFGSYGPRVVAALDDDLDTPTALEVILGLADDILEAHVNADVRGAQDVLRATASGLLGLWLRPLAEVPAADQGPWPKPTFGDPDRDVPVSGAEPDAATT
jgi:L-cysteine:1D-myo-inositol 2-amino-2-deoxy-alpha-D-glucopyranoside ligase